MNSKAPKSSALSRLFDKQQPKINTSVRITRVLNTYANDSHKAIATLIGKWLEDDEKAAKK